MFVWTATLLFHILLKLSAGLSGTLLEVSFNRSQCLLKTVFPDTSNSSLIPNLSVATDSLACSDSGNGILINSSASSIPLKSSVNISNVIPSFQGDNTNMTIEFWLKFPSVITAPDGELMFSIECDIPLSRQKCSYLLKVIDLYKFKSYIFRCFKLHQILRR